MVDRTIYIRQPTELHFEKTNQSFMKSYELILNSKLINIKI